MARNRKAALILAAGLLAGGGAGLVLGLSQASNAADSSTPTAPAASTATPAAGTKHASNEDATHEAGETPEQEAAEDNGTAHMGHGRGGHSNEDPAHEAAESPEREKAEDAAAANAGGTETPATAVAPSSSNA